MCLNNTESTAPVHFLKANSTLTKYTALIHKLRDKLKPSLILKTKSKIIDSMLWCIAKRERLYKPKLIMTKPFPYARLVRVPSCRGSDKPLGLGQVGSLGNPLSDINH